MAVMPALHPAARGSYVHDFDDVPLRHRKAFSAATEGVETTISPGEVLFIPMGWWHHVEQIDSEDLPISLTLFSNYASHMDELVNEHDMTRRRLDFDRRLEQQLAQMIGGKRAVEYFHALDHGKFDKGCKENNNCAHRELRRVHKWLHGAI